MRAARAALLFAALAAAAPPPGRAGDIVTGFVPGGPAPAEVLRHVAVKGLVAEFLDPGDTGLGKALGYLLWREVLTAISDQAGAGVILARPPGETRLTDLLGRDYHRAAVEIARAQNARLVLWGIASEADGRVYLESHLTLLPEAVGDDLSLTLVLGGQKAAPLSAEVARSRYNFAVVETGRDELFLRALVPRRDLTVRREPAPDGAPLKTVRAADVLRAVGMEGAWFRVRLADGREGWVENGQVEVPPRAVAAPRGRYRLTADARGSAGVRTTELGGVYRVLDMRYVPKRGTVYRLDLGTSSAWVEAAKVRARYSVPAVHLVAALYRFQRGNLPEAKRALDAFLAEAGPAESNVNLSSAYQLRGATLLSQTALGNQDALDDVGRAVDLTPYDPAAYRLRALASLGARGSLERATPDLGRALELDRLDPGSLRLLAGVSDLVDPTNESLRRARERFYISSADKTAVLELRARFPAPPPQLP